MNTKSKTIIEMFNYILTKNVGNVITNDLIEDICNKVSKKISSDYFEDFSTNIDYYINDKELDIHSEHSTFKLCYNAYIANPEQTVELLFEKFLDTDDNLIKINAIACLYNIANIVDTFSEKELQWFYSILRMSFESNSNDLKLCAVELIEQIRNKVCLNILLDYNTNDYLPDWLLKYANQIIDELEEEQSDEDKTDK